jgi:hypothetical protein
LGDAHPPPLARGHKSCWRDALTERPFSDITHYRSNPLWNSAKDRRPIGRSR